MPDIQQQYENLHLQKTAAVSRRIRKVYEAGIQEITATLSTVKFNGKPFKLSDYPSLKKKVDAVTAKMKASIYAINVNGIKDSWDLANSKNNVILDKRLAKKKVPKKVKQVLYDPNKGALDSFLSRKEKGLNLSDRVWRTLDPMKRELEQSLGLAISKGESAIKTAKQVKQYLNEPDKLFRRVRDEEGKLVLSQAARNYHPGQGVYRSSYKNALRLTRTENNLAYRYADHERWQNMPFVTGIEIKLSKAHPKYDICDSLVGKYPKDFKFGGWHPQCLCYQTPVMSSDEDFEKMEDAILAGEPIPTATGQIRDTPKGFKDWISENKTRVDRWKNQPYWMKDNPDYIKGIKAAPIFTPAAAPAKVPGVPVPPAPALNSIKERVMANNATAIDDIKKHFDFPEELLEHLGEEISFDFDLNKRSAYFNPADKKIVIGNTGTRGEKSEFFRNTLLRHELGHAIHTTRGIINTRLGAVSPEFQKHFRSLQKLVSGKGHEIETAFRKEYMPVNLIGDTDTKEQLLVIFDILGSLTKGRFGGGHSKAYYKNRGSSEAEIFAHSVSLFKVKNKFDKLTPEIEAVTKSMKAWISKIL